jgi:hypothetical protein
VAGPATADSAREALKVKNQADRLMSMIENGNSLRSYRQ